MEIPRLSDTRWVSQYAAIHLLEQFGSLICTFKTIAKGSNDGCERAEARELLQQLKCFSFFNLLCIFTDILGITKILSDTL